MVLPCLWIRLCSCFKERQDEKAEAGMALQPDFDKHRFTGDWYEVFRSQSVEDEKGTDIKVTYSMVPEKPNQFGVTTVQTLKNGKVKTRTGTGKPAGKGITAADMHVKWNLCSGCSYKIMSTDYESYAVVYAAHNTCFKRKRCVWILGRKTDLPSTVNLDSLFEMVAKETGIPRDHFIAGIHSAAEAAGSEEPSE
jgi:lipocalin